LAVKLIVKQGGEKPTFGRVKKGKVDMPGDGTGKKRKSSKSLILTMQV